MPWRGLYLLGGEGESGFRGEFRAVMTVDHNRNDFARCGCRSGDLDEREIFCAADPVALDQNVLLRADQALHMTEPGRVGGFAQAFRPLLDDLAGELRHAGRRRSLTWREGEDVQMGEAAFLDDLQRVLEMLVRFGGEAGDDIGAEGGVRAQPADVLAKGDGILARMAALHPLQNEIVAMLQREMEMRHEARLGRDRLHQVFIGLDGIDRGKAQPVEFRYVPQDRAHQPAEARLARQVRSVAGQIDAGQHDLAIAVFGEPLDLVDCRTHRHGARIATAIGDDAERAAVVAAILHLHEGARAALDGVDHMRRGLGHLEDIVDPDLLELVDPEFRQGAIALRFQLVVIADDEIDFFHAAKGAGLRLGGAAGDDDAGIRILAARLADRLSRLPNGLAGHGAGVEDDRAAVEFAEARCLRLAAHDFGLIGVQPAPEGDDIDGHQIASCEGAFSSRLHAPVSASR